MSGRNRPSGPDWVVVAGYAVGVGITFVATLGVFLQYSLTSLTAATAGLASLALGAVVGSAWAWLRRLDGGEPIR